MIALEVRLHVQADDLLDLVEANAIELKLDRVAFQGLENAKTEGTVFREAPFEDSLLRDD